MSKANEDVANQQLYTLADCFDEYYKTHRTDRREIYRRLDEFFERYGFREEWLELREELKWRRKVWNEENKKLFNLILEEREHRLQYRNGKFIEAESDPRFIIEELHSGLIGLFERSKDSIFKAKFKEKLEKKATTLIKNWSNVGASMNEKMSNLVHMINTGPNSYLRAIDKYYLLKAMEEDLDKYIEKWEKIYQALDRKYCEEVCDICAKYDTDSYCEANVQLDGEPKKILVNDELNKRYSKRINTSFDELMLCDDDIRCEELRADICKWTNKRNERRAKILQKIKKEFKKSQEEQLMKDIEERLSNPAQRIEIFLNIYEKNPNCFSTILQGRKRN